VETQGTGGTLYAEQPENPAYSRVIGEVRDAGKARAVFAIGGRLWEKDLGKRNGKEENAAAPI